ncbi:MerR family transcriptional regulator [Clostridium aminobutyricum]|uniref:MerR family transcriptional regulator n=1 Tax=Clostridium aminobutyricum TaxID=33953 RepID=A0A939DA12_CLOAM|nr:MerR family transcriptional regulator [Clostridium aminobutyricum]MBN7773972.1 MerR family transcriptional regulator [Clostridium aminobutyricum]
MKDKFLIGELAKLFNISTDTLRHYDKIALLKPNYNLSNDYRYYSLANFFELSRILFFKSLDISLGDIKMYMNNKNRNNLLDMLKRKEEEIDVKINRLYNLKKKIQTKVGLLESTSDELNQVRIKSLPEKIGVFLDMNAVESDVEIIQAFKKNEKYFKSSSWLIEGQVYTSLSKEDMKNQIFNRFRYFIEMVTLDQVPHTQMQVIPEGQYACIAFLGPYRDMAKHYELLLQWIIKNGYQVAGDSIEKNIVDYGFSDSENEYISEIQIPIIPTYHDPLKSV